ncbi:phosphate acyltransferase PlsX [Peptoniphilus equinus]|uniref:Phosphate acyltransferase n=1 Tax=Peptoniphilus equinus TaxID=3016343 RepID=A0ABY7QV04_9FIRM|nr:phosphate acyltransferase PlsX [Peptoniphilus equinus]WBW50617.1 phosphate acyltransferase PlsX [Peptoniphilus equinus]
MKLLFDAQGGDHAPEEIVEGAKLAQRELGIAVGLIGNTDVLAPMAESIPLHHAGEVIENNEDPAMALRRKKDASLTKGLALVKDGTYDGFISAGSTGALLAGGLFIVGRIPGIKRAVLPTPIPTVKGTTYVVDSGANMDTTPELLLQFAVMGSEYAKVKGIDNPRIGLLNVGEEAHKGNALVKKTYELLQDSDLNFIGNVEARTLFEGICDVLVTDGFAGNVLLKTTEGVASYVFHEIKASLAGLEPHEQQVVAKILGGFKHKVSYEEVGGALLLGINGILIKAHGSSKRRAIFNAAKEAQTIYEQNIVTHIKQVMEDL